MPAKGLYVANQSADLLKNSWACLAYLNIYRHQVRLLSQNTGREGWKSGAGHESLPSALASAKLISIRTIMEDSSNYLSLARRP
jgi:hypothetical protein